jgi:oxalate decarboxylase/phosphoglucose isomerase-like protein (cupin superfamily)
VQALPTSCCARTASKAAGVQIGEQTWHIKPGTFVKVPAYKQHRVTNTGTEDLIFLVIYDPPPADDRFPELRPR